MERPRHNEPLGSPLLQELYGEGYFHGANSGFAQEGYARVHATWRHWMPWLREEVGAGARWLDLGCAYGFLVREALQSGFRGFGLDASRYALGQAREHAGDAAGRVLQGHAEVLPFADDAFDVVTAFDLLEHVAAPERLVSEVARVLRPGGIFIAATPDPRVFDRDEPTHISEHVPSWWVRVFESAGFGVTLRFFQAEYNCELVARRGGRAPDIAFDSFESESVVEVAGDSALRVAPRSGIGRVEPDGGRVIEDGATFYLLNAARKPLSVQLALRTEEPARLCLRLDGRVVARSDGASVDLEANFLLAAGGHPIEVGVEGGWARLQRLVAGAQPAGYEALCATLPFDLYERYALTAEVLRRIATGSRTVLDVGGTMGGDAGHLAWTGDFLPDRDVTVIDTRPADLPEHHAIAVDGPLPFPDGAFDTVLSQDVLEHVPAAARRVWLEEVWRVTGDVLLLACPWATEGVAEADRYLFDLIRREYGYEHGFLSEHLSYGHPDLAATCRFFEDRGATVVDLPSGNLTSWIHMQTVNARLSHPVQDRNFVRANEAFNRSIAVGAAKAPAYRHLLVIDRRGRDLRPALLDLVSAGSPDGGAVRAALSALSLAPSRPGTRVPVFPVSNEEVHAHDVAIAIPSCNGRALLETCLESLRRVEYPRERIEILVYDNGSTDGTPEWLAAEHPGVRVLAAVRNEGFAAPCNRLARAARSGLVCFVNNDVQVEPGFLDALIEARLRTGAACVGARVLSADGARIEFDGGTMNFLGHGAPLHSGVRVADVAAGVEPRDSLFASGAAMLVDRQAFLAAGGFDEDYFAYFEDVDLGWRFWTLGERCVVAPAARVRHREHASEELLPPGRRLALLERNAILSVVKNYEEARAGRVLRAALALVAERERLASDPARRRACREGLLSATAALPAAERRAVALRARRRRGDAEIASLFVEPWRAPIAGDRYDRRQLEVALLFGAADLFEPPGMPEAPAEEPECA